jgi:imidazoleglycerol-phosphate dehydratase
VERETKESSVLVEVDLDGTGRTDVDTGVPFYDHMLSQLGKHGGFDLTVRTRGDLEIDAHHTVEDTAIALGEAFRQALGDKVAVDLSGRPYLVHTEPDNMPPTIGPVYATTLTRHVFESFVHHAKIALHVRVLGGRDAHHIVEAQFKAVARALRDATAVDPKVVGVPSTKGVL